MDRFDPKRKVLISFCSYYRYVTGIKDFFVSSLCHRSVPTAEQIEMQEDTGRRYGTVGQTMYCSTIAFHSD